MKYLCKPMNRHKSGKLGQFEIQIHYEANLKGWLSINCFQRNFQNLIQDSLSQREQCLHR